MTTTTTKEDIKAIADELVPRLKASAFITDQEKRFPEENLALLKASGLMGLLIPCAFGGMGGDAEDMMYVARKFGAACLTTSVIWAMHCQQIAVLVNHTCEEYREDILRKIATESYYVGSVTTEEKKGGHLLTAFSALQTKESAIVLERIAPIITGGPYCDAYLITMKSAGDAPDSDVKLVYAERHEGDFTQLSEWSAMGMRGTSSVRMKISISSDKLRLINPRQDFREIAVESMIPVGHIAWASGWLGAATATYNQMIGIFRNPDKRKAFDLGSDLLLEKLGRIRMDIDVVTVFTESVVTSYVELVSSAEKRGELYLNPFQLKINSLKVMSSEVLFNVVHKIVDVLGLRYGYMTDAELPVERTFRDLRAGSLMYHNDRLLIVNGKLSLLSPVV